MISAKMKALFAVICFLLVGYGSRVHAAENIAMPQGLQEMIGDINERWFQELSRLASLPPKESRISATIYISDEGKLLVRDISGTSKKKLIRFTRKLIEQTNVDPKVAESMRKFRPEIRELTLTFVYE